MTTRSFIKSVLFTAIAPSILLPVLKDAHKWKRNSNVWVPNLNWSKAPYEIAYWGDWPEYSDFWKRYLELVSGQLCYGSIKVIKQVHPLIFLRK